VLTKAFEAVSDVETLDRMDEAIIQGSASLLVVILAVTSATSYAIGADRVTTMLPLVLLVWDAGCLVLARRGYPRAAAIALCIGIMAIMLLSAPYYGGLHGTTIQALPMMPLFAALLVGPRAGFAMAGLAALLVFVQWYVEGTLGLLPVRTPSSEDQVITTVGLVGTIAALSGLKVFQLRRAARAARDAERIAREAESHLRDALTAATAASQAKSRFLANMSHELRTPLNAIIGYAEFLHEDAADAEAASDLERIRTAGAHLLQLVNDVLDLGKIEAGRMSVTFESVDVAAVVEEVVQTVRPAVQERGSTLRTELAPDIGSVETDPIRVRQILLNLLSNAAKFTEQGTVRVVAERGGSGGDRVRISVIDTGIGIAPSRIERLFEPFVQGDETTSRRYGGTGLGLALSAHFARLLGARLDVDSELGKGSTFTLVLPAEQPVASESRADRAAG